jgi:hypothetical protein
MTLDMVRAGLHCSFKISRQMLPLLLILGWKTFVLNATCRNQSKEEKKNVNYTTNFQIVPHPIYKRTVTSQKDETDM